MLRRYARAPPARWRREVKGPSCLRDSRVATPDATSLDPGTLRPVVAFLYGPVHGFMLWNAFLAGCPAALALALFTRPAPERRGVLWWAGLAAWVLFLPNAPYVLTDVVHMIDDIQRAHSDAWA